MGAVIVPEPSHARGLDPRSPTDVVRRERLRLRMNSTERRAGKGAGATLDVPTTAADVFAIMRAWTGFDRASSTFSRGIVGGRSTSF